MKINKCKNPTFFLVYSSKIYKFLNQDACHVFSGIKWKQDYFSILHHFTYPVNVFLISETCDI